MSAIDKTSMLNASICPFLSSVRRMGDTFEVVVQFLDFIFTFWLLNYIYLYSKVSIILDCDGLGDRYFDRSTAFVV